MYRKILSLSDCEIKMTDDAARFTGYASTFGGNDSYGDTIMKGAYADTLRRDAPPKMFVQHKSNDLPVGKWIDVYEDDRGLAAEGEFTPGMNRAEEARAALRHGTVDGLSIGCLLKKNDYEEKDGRRIIHRVDRLLEISIVTFPADDAARIDLASVKAEIDQLETVRDYERFLRDAGTFSKALTAALVGRAKIVFSRGEPDEEKIDAKAMAEIERSIASIRALARKP